MYAGTYSTLSDYERRELTDLQKQVENLKKGTTAEKRESTNKYIQELKGNREIFQRTVNWIENGTYGFGAQWQLREWIKRAKTSRKPKGEANPRWLVSSIVTLVGALEWMAPIDYTTRYWKELTQADWNAIADIITEEIKGFEDN